MKRKVIGIFLMILTSIFLVACGNTNIKWREDMEDGRMSFNSKSELEEFFRESKDNYDGIWDYVDQEVILPNDDGPQLESGEVGRDFVDTNNQVEDVDEGDLVKTDGTNIYYAPRYGNVVNHLNVLETGEIKLHNQLFFEDVEVEALFLTDEHLIVIANSGYYFGGIDFSIGFEFQTKSFVKVYNKDSLDLLYSFDIAKHITNYRLIDNTLFFTYFQSNTIPVYNETIDGKTTKQELSYKDVYYFEDEESHYLTVYNLLDLDKLELNSQGYLGYIHLLHVSKTSVYTANFIYDFYIDEDGSYEAKNTTSITKLDISGKSVKFIAKGVVDGYIEDSYWMDEYNGYLRLMTTTFNPVVNSLYILKEKDYKLEVVSKLDEGIGKPRETIKSVRFSKDRAFVVTFEQIDPLYTIDLSNVLEPVIISDIEEDGYNTYLHIWDEDMTKLIGLGYDADKTGRLLGYKMSAYEVSEEDPLYTYYFNDKFIDKNIYIEATHNPKLLLISPKFNVVGMTVYSSYYDGPSNYVKRSEFYLFEVDFNNEKVIKDPIIISHETNNDYRNNIDRGVMIVIGENAYIYTLSSTIIKTYSLTKGMVIGNLIIGGNHNKLPGDDQISN